MLKGVASSQRETLIFLMNKVRLNAVLIPRVSEATETSGGKNL
jgi:hypothetical protein